MSNNFSEDPMFGRMLGQLMRQGSDYGDLLKQKDQLVNLQSQAMNEKDKMLINAYLRIMELQQEVTSLQSTVQELNSEISELDDKSATYIYGLTGMRSVVRELLSELRAADKNNPLLDKSVRDAIYDKMTDNIESGLIAANRKDLFNFSVKAGEEAMGVKDSNAVGPSKDQISSNKALRKEVGVPDHIPENQRLMGLVNILHKELQEANPDSPALQNKAISDVLEELVMDNPAKKTFDVSDDQISKAIEKFSTVMKGLKD